MELAAIPFSLFRSNGNLNLLVPSRSHAPAWERTCGRSASRQPRTAERCNDRSHAGAWEREGSLASFLPSPRIERTSFASVASSLTSMKMRPTAGLEYMGSVERKLSWVQIPPAPCGAVAEWPNATEELGPKSRRPLCDLHRLPVRSTWLPTGSIPDQPPRYERGWSLCPKLRR
jgi:hypothetical protein